MSLTIRLVFSPVWLIGRRRKGGFEIALMQAMEEMQTRLHPPNSSTHFSYNRVPWKLKVSLEQEEINCHAWIFQIRKEVFSPSEQLTNPTTVHLVFCQASFSFWFFSLMRYIYRSMKLTDPQFRSSLTHSARCASAWLSLRGKRWWATWTNTTSAPRTSTAHSTRTLQRWELKKKNLRLSHIQIKLSGQHHFHGKGLLNILQ